MESAAPVLLRVIGLDGQLVLEHTTHRADAQLNVNGLARGMYVIQAQQNGFLLFINCSSSNRQHHIRVAWNADYAHALPEGHRFPMEKYELVPEQLVHEGTLSESQFFSPTPLGDEVGAPGARPGVLGQTEGRRALAPGGTPDRVSVVRGVGPARGDDHGGTVECARHAFESGVALNIAGGTHHAYRDRGEGFCLLNDFALAAAALLEEGRIERALIVDLDVHQGNGTAKIFENDSRVFTFSMHGAGNYPMHKEASDLGRGLARWHR